MLKHSDVGLVGNEPADIFGVYPVKFSRLLDSIHKSSDGDSKTKIGFDHVQIMQPLINTVMGIGVVLDPPPGNRRS